jgi:poly [ADP-ribose] polymerase
MAQADLSHPNLKVKKLICVTANNRNKYYNMFEQPNGTFKAAYGRVDGPETVKDYPMSKWDSILADKTGRREEPYRDNTDLFITEAAAPAADKKKSTGMFSASRSAEVQQFIKALMSHANASVQQNYKVEVNAVTKVQVAAAQAQLNKLTQMAKPGQRIDDFNQALIDLFMIIPRKMKRVQEHILVDLEGYKGSTLTQDLILNQDNSRFSGKGVNIILSEEQATLDVMAGQVNANVAVTEDEGDGQEHDILTTLNLDCELVTSAAEIAMIKKKMDHNPNGRSGDEQSHRFIRAFRVSNKRSDVDFDKYIGGQGNKKKELLWHGSRNENWWSIYQQSLKIRPTNAVITGKMFGYGIYFADKAKKSIGYTSGGYWAGGASRGSGYLALYDVHQGNTYNVKKHDSRVHPTMTWDKLRGLGDYDSLFATGGYDLINNEYIVYQEPQCAIRYIVEFKA